MKISRRAIHLIILIATIISVVLITLFIASRVSLISNLSLIALSTAFPIIIGGIYFDLQGHRVLMFRLPLIVFFLGLILYGLFVYLPLVILGSLEVDHSLSMSIYMQSWTGLAGGFLLSAMLYSTFSFFQLITTYIILVVYLAGKLIIKKLR